MYYIYKYIDKIYIFMGWIVKVGYLGNKWLKWCSLGKIEWK